MDKTILKGVILVNLILCGAAVVMAQENVVQSGFAQVDPTVPLMNGLEACALAHPEPFNHNIRIAQDLGATEAEIKAAIEYVYEAAVEEGICK